MSTPSSPVPTPTENTRLLNENMNHYSQPDASTSITIQPESNGYPHSRSIVSGAPTVPINQLTEKIQDILVFTEVKKRQQERLVEDSKRNIRKVSNRKSKRSVSSSSNSSSSSSSSSNSDSDDNTTKQNLKKKLSEWSLTNSSSASLTPSQNEKKVRKRDFAVDAIRFATDKWKDKHGFSTPLPPPAFTVPASATNTSDSTSKPKIYQPVQVPSSAESILKVAKNASVCAVLALLHERRQSSDLDAATDISLQTLALETLTLSLSTQINSTSHIILYDMLTTKWMNNKSALEWAYENNSHIVLNDPRVQLVIEDYWRRGSRWREDPSHPSHLWLSHKNDKNKKHFVWNLMHHTMADYLALWASPRYQGWIGLFVGVLYLMLHLGAVTNLEYTSDSLFVFEYAYYYFVISDVLLELYRLLAVRGYLKRLSSYISLSTVVLLTYSFVLRLYGLYWVEGIEEQYHELYVSFTLLILATPLMFFRLLSSWSTNVCWSSAKSNYILGQCIRNSIWVFGLSIMIIIGFWVALGAFQYDDVAPVTMLRLLVLGALHAPQIGNTLFYQPQVASILLSVYLFLTVIFMGSLLIASFMSTLLDINARMEIIKREWIIRRNIGSHSELGMFIPNVLLDSLIGFMHWVSHVIFQCQNRIKWIDQLHQIGWYITYSPYIFMTGLVHVFIGFFSKLRK